MGELGGGVSTFQNDSSPLFYNKQAIKMEMRKIIRLRLPGQGLCISVCILVNWAATEVQRERALEDGNALSIAEVIDCKISFVLHTSCDF